MKPWLQLAGPERMEWVLLIYRLPREPSTPRIALWRKLRRLGALQIADGVVALPADARTTEAFEWLAEDVTEAGGDATLWRGAPMSVDQERSLAAQMAGAVAREYAALSTAAEAARGEEPAARRRSLLRLRRELRRIAQRDFFPPSERDRARAAVDALAAAVEEMVS